MLQNRQVKVVQVLLEVILLLKTRKSGLQGLLWPISNHKQMGPMVLGKVNHQSYHIYFFDFVTYQKFNEGGDPYKMSNINVVQSC